MHASYSFVYGTLRFEYSQLTYKHLKVSITDVIKSALVHHTYKNVKIRLDMLNFDFDYFLFSMSF